ncbi:MAG: hypothetical protein JW795_10775 [Chitinivibrionales bacterium]|nr:hypothetical protein [Chitinivibrionales bacterium]
MHSSCDVWHTSHYLIEPYSAGIETHGLNPNAVTVMAEAGMDIAHHRSKHLNEVKDIAFDWVITVYDSANEQCPLFPGTVKRYHVSFDEALKGVIEALIFSAYFFR